MKLLAAASALGLAGCATLTPPGYPPRYAHHQLPRVYAYPAYPAPGPYPAYPMPASLPPAQQAASGAYPVPGTPLGPQSNPYNPYTQEQMATGIAEALGFAALLSAGLEGNSSGGPSTGGGGTFTGGGGGLPDFTLHGEPPPYADLQ
jgi:hypothetical protein